MIFFMDRFEKREFFTQNKLFIKMKSSGKKILLISQKKVSGNETKIPWKCKLGKCPLKEDFNKYI